MKLTKIERNVLQQSLHSCVINIAFDESHLKGSTINEMEMYYEESFYVLTDAEKSAYKSVVQKIGKSTKEEILAELSKDRYGVMLVNIPMNR